MNKPIGGIIGSAAREESLASMAPPSGAGVTAGSVTQQETPVRSQFEFVARGGISNTADEYVKKAGRQMRLRDQMKQFEQILAGQEKSAKAVYEDAVKVYGEEIKNWIPVPEMFVDESTGAFMPMQYQKALFTGVQEFKKMQKEQKAQEIAGSREERLGAAQVEQIAQGQEKLKQGAQGLAQTGAYQQGQLAIGRERNRIETVKAGKTAATDDQKLIKEYETQLYKDQQEINRLGDDIRNAESTGDEKGVRDATQQRKKMLSHAMDTEKTIKKIKANAAGKPIDEKAITVATDIENSVAGLLPSDDFETKYGFSVDKTDEQGNKVPIDAESDPIALKVYMYAQTIGVSNPKLTVQKIADMLKSTPLEDIIQVIHKQRKSGIGK